jgi:hypothetical protein
LLFTNLSFLLQDLLTGFHLVDGVRRIIMLEGLCDGALQIVKVILVSQNKINELWHKSGMPVRL